MNVQTTYRPDIDGLRGVAITAVVLFHAFPNHFPGGFVGVDVFFVISGYLISSIVAAEMSAASFSFRDFYARRVRRLFPALGAVLIACLLFGWIALLADEYKQLGKHAAGAAGFVSNLVFWQEAGYFDNSAETKPLLHLWSLGVEEQFYLMWPVLLYFAFRKRFNLLSLALLVVAISFALNIRTSGADSVQGFYSPATRIWELLLGSALALLKFRRSDWLAGPMHRADVVVGRIIFEREVAADGTVLRDSASILGAILIGLAIVLVSKEAVFPGWWSLLPTVGAFAIVAAGPAARFNRAFLCNRMLVFLGLISYPLYLWHWPLLSFVRIIESSQPSVVLRLVTVLASLVLAALTYLLIERPIRFGERRAVAIPALVAVVAAVGLAGYGVFLKDGLANRPANAGFGDAFTFSFAEDCDRFGWKGGLCHFGDGPDGSNSILIGDSFANSYAMFLAAIKHKASFEFTQAGLGLCPLLLDFGPPDCAAAAMKTFELVKAHENLKLVFLSANYDWYLSGQAGTKFGPSASREAFVSALKNTVSGYRAMGRKVAILLTPPYGKDPKSCVPRPFKLTSCDFPRPSRIETSNGEVRALWLPQDQPLAFDPFPYMCDATSCLVTNGRSDIYYIDSWHLGRKGAEFLANAAMADFARLLAD